MIPSFDIDFDEGEWDQLVEDLCDDRDRPRWLKEELIATADSILELAIAISKHIDDQGYVQVHEPAVRGSLIAFKLAVEELEDAL
jgi:hypothetical protein